MDLLTAIAVLCLSALSYTSCAYLSPKSPAPPPKLQQKLQSQSKLQQQQQQQLDIPNDPNSRVIQVTPCESTGVGTVKWVRVTPCSSDPCVFAPQSKVRIDVSAIAPRDIESATLQAFVPGMSQPFPGFSMDICEQTQCPILNGTEFLLSHTLTIPVVPTRVVSDVNFLATTNGGEELLSCVSVHVILDDGRPHFIPAMDAVTALKQVQDTKKFIDPFGFSDIFIPQPKAYFRRRE